MTDDPTQRYDTKPAGDSPAPDGDAPAPAPDAATAADASAATEAAPAMGLAPQPMAQSTDAGSAAPDAPTMPAAAVGASRTKWLAALGIAGVVLVAGLAALLLFGKTSAAEALTYVPGDAALVIELRPELPGDQLQALGNLLAHFPGFQDQSTLSAKIDEALKRIIAQAPGSSVDYEKDVKPFLSGPMFVSVRSFEDMARSEDPKNFAVVATTTGAVTCDKTLGAEQVTTETYNGVQLSISAGGKMACVIDGRFAIAGDPLGVKAAIDARKASSGMDKSVRYQAARTQLGLDRLVTLYVDGSTVAKALPSADPSSPIADLADVFPQWIMAGVRAENDAIVIDTVIAPALNPSAAPSMQTFPPVHPIAFTAFAPPETLAYFEAQGAGVSIRNVFGQLASDPQLSEALKALDTFGGLDGIVGWVDDAGFIVFRDGDAPAGGIILAATDAASASQKVTALETVLGLGALGGEIDVTTSTVEGVKVTAVRIPDVNALSGGTLGGAVVPLDLSIAAKDRYVIVGVGANAMPKMLGVKAGSGLADDAAFKRALSRGLPNPQVVLYVAAGATLDWIDTAAGALGSPPMPADLKPYLDPLEGFIYTVVGDGLLGSFRIALTVSN